MTVFSSENRSTGAARYLCDWLEYQESMTTKKLARTNLRVIIVHFSLLKLQTTWQCI